MNIIKQILVIIVSITILGCNRQTPTVTLSNILTGHTEPINCLSYSPDGNLLASGSAAESILSDSGKFEIIIWKVSNGKPLASLKGHNSPILSISFDRSGKQLVSADTRGEIRIWSIENMQQIKFIDGLEWISTVCFTLDSRFIVGEYSYGKKVSIWDSVTGELISTLPVNRQIGSMDISPDGSKIALSCYHSLQIWSLISKKKLLSIEDNSVNGFGIKYSNDGRKLAVGLGNGDIKIFDPETLNLLNLFQGHFKPVLSVSFNKENEYLVSGSSDQMIKLWNLKTQSEMNSLVNEHKGTVEDVVFNPMSNSFSSTGRDKLIKIWNIK